MSSPAPRPLADCSTATIIRNRAVAGSCYRNGANVTLVLLGTPECHLHIPGAVMFGRLLGRRMVDMKHWLEELSLGEHAQAFAENDIDFDLLPALSDAELERLGLSLGHRKRLQHAVAALENPASGRSSPSTPAPIAAAAPAD